MWRCMAKVQRVPPSLPLGLDIVGQGLNQCAYPFELRWSARGWGWQGRKEVVDILPYN